MNPKVGQGFFSIVFLVSKPEGTLRMIVNLEYLNNLIKQIIIPDGNHQVVYRDPQTRRSYVNHQPQGFLL